VSTAKSPVSSKETWSPRRWGFLGLCLLQTILILVCGTAHAQAAQPQPIDSAVSREHLIKAAFIYNFIKFVDWPASVYNTDGGTITVAIYGEDPFGQALETIQGKSVAGRKVVVKFCRSPRELEGCEVLFIPRAEQEALPQIMSALKDGHCLTISDIDDFSQKGGMITFVIVENKVRFTINLVSAEKAKLKISSQLLKLAYQVYESPRTGGRP